MNKVSVVNIYFIIVILLICMDKVILLIDLFLFFYEKNGF